MTQEDALPRAQKWQTRVCPIRNTPDSVEHLKPLLSRHALQRSALVVSMCRVSVRLGLWVADVMYGIAELSYKKLPRQHVEKLAICKNNRVFRGDGIC